MYLTYRLQLRLLYPNYVNVRDAMNCATTNALYVHESQSFRHVILSNNFKHSVPMELKTLINTHFYKHSVPMGLKIYSR